jgi:Mn2+/Fe2+ NRAMP family transporter
VGGEGLLLCDHRLDGHWHRNRLSPIDPIKALFWSAVINGVVAVPIMAAMMLVISRQQTMGRFTGQKLLVSLGWCATAIIAAAAVAMFAFWGS